jgi:autotransporter passenger strand-loop-strand repeat protein
LAVTGEYAGGTTGGTLSGGTVETGGVLVQGAQSEAEGVIVQSGATLLELTGVTSNIMLAGTQFVATTLFGPAQATVASGTTVASGGALWVAADGSAVNANVLSGGEIVFNGGVVSGLSLASGAVIDLATLAYNSAETLSFTENGTGTGGALTVTSGGQSQVIGLLGQYAAAGFDITRNAAGATAITYAPPTSQAEIAAGHG